MSSSTIYLGPFIEAKNVLKEAVEQKRACTAKGCKKNGKRVLDPDGVFCASCGARIATVDSLHAVPAIDAIKIAGRVGFYYISPADLSMLGKTTDIFIDNEASPPYGTQLLGGEYKLVEVTSAMVAQALLAFASHYAEKIDCFRDAYGEQNVTVKWGLLHYLCH